MDATYKGKQIKYLVPTHVYSIQFDKPKNHAYNCHVLWDITIDTEIDEWINYSSELSIRGHWDIKEFNIIDNE